MRQELRVRVFLDLLECLQSLLLELDGLFHVLLLAVNDSDLNVTVSYLLGLGTKRHFVKLPRLTKYIECLLVAFLSQVNLSNNLQNLPI